MNLVSACLDSLCRFALSFLYLFQSFVAFVRLAFVKADILNKQFHSVYTKEDYANMPDKGSSPYPSMMKIQVNNQGVVKLRRGLRPFKATGPD
jgi:hypothetical protein